MFLVEGTFVSCYRVVINNRVQMARIRYGMFEEDNNKALNRELLACLLVNGRVGGIDLQLDLIVFEVKI